MKIDVEKTLLQALKKSFKINFKLSTITVLKNLAFYESITYA